MPTSRVAAFLIFLTIVLPPRARAQQPAEPAIADNSFLIEEAYNQEPGVVQHISTFQVAGATRRDLFYTLTQEWPFHGQRHQLSYSVPLTRLDGGSVGFGDVLLNYRQQFGMGGRRWALAPRLSAVLPTGSVARGLGNGSVGLQFNLPLSYTLGRRVVGHWNAGTTILPWAQGPSTGGTRARRTLASYNLGASVIAPTDLPVQVMVESVVAFQGEIRPGGSVGRSTVWVLNPGLRAAINVGKLQIVPGLSIPLTTEGGDTERGAFFYLSFEHPFTSAPAEAD